MTHKNVYTILVTFRRHLCHHIASFLLNAWDHIPIFWMIRTAEHLSHSFWPHCDWNSWIQHTVICLWSWWRPKWKHWPGYLESIHFGNNFWQVGASSVLHRVQSWCLMWLLVAYSSFSSYTFVIICSLLSLQM